MLSSQQSGLASVIAREVIDNIVFYLPQECGLKVTELKSNSEIGHEYAIARHLSCRL